MDQMSPKQLWNWPENWCSALQPST